MTTIERNAIRPLLAGILVAAVVPFLAVKIFTTQLYAVMTVTSYLVFHNVAEFFSVMVSFSIFGLGWFAYDQNKDRHALFLSAAFLAIGLMDFMHTLGYAGMPALITPNNANKSTQFWIAVRLFNAAAFLVSAFVSSERAGRWLSKTFLLAVALVIPAAVFIGITFFPDNVPLTFIHGVGLTPFKKIAECVIICLFSLAGIVYWQRFFRTGERVIVYYLPALVLCICSELVFAVYKSVFDTYNVLGHIYKIVAFGLIYKGVFIASVNKPYAALLVAIDDLRQNRNMLVHIMNTIPQAIFWKDRESVYLGCNQVFARQAGCDNTADIIGKSDFDLPWTREEGEQYRVDDRYVMDNSAPRRHIIETQRQLDGTISWVDTTKVPLTDSSGRVTGVLGVYEDVTGRKQAEEALQEALNFNQQVINCAQEGIIVYDLDLRYQVWNPFMETMSGVKAAAVLGRKPTEVFPFLEETGVMARLSQVLAGEEVQTVEFPFSVPESGKSGWNSDSSAPLLNAAGEICGVISTVRDTTENRKIAEQLRQSQKMESIGTLAGGIAHDFNNILTVIIGYGQIAQMNLAPDDPQRASIQQMLDAAERAAHLTKDLLIFSRKQASDKQTIDLNHVVLKVEKFLRKLIGEDVEYKTVLHDGPLQVCADEHQLEQVLMNLVINAGHAMPQGGELLVTTARVTLEEGFVSSHGNDGKPGLYALLTVTDTGVGMDAGTQQRIFEPFFTTKEVGKGTGLGLAVVYGIIKLHDGYINVSSEPGVGTTFSIYLPLDTVGVAAASLEKQEVAVVGGKETILLAEDDEMVRKLMNSVLTEFGYTVIEAVDGADAVSRFAENCATIDLLILDLIMPKMNGKEAFDAIRKTRPAIKAIFASGYSPDTISQKITLEDGAHVLAKPIAQMVLLRKVRSVLDENAPG